MELIRDNLIQNGISFPTKSFEKYEDCFFVSERLASLSWFLFVNNVSGSTIGEGYSLFPQQTYKQKIRSLVYSEYVDVGKDFAGMMLPRRRTDDVDSNFNFLSKSQARISPFEEQYSKVESAGNEFLDLVKKSQETVEEDDFDSWDDFDVKTAEEPEEAVESQEDIEVANLVEDEDGFLVDEDSLEASDESVSGFEDDSNESEEWSGEDSEDDFDGWGNSNDEEEDEFESWDNSDEEEDNFDDWGTDTSEVEDEDDFDDWGSSDEDEEDSDDWESPSEEDEDDFDDWGSSDDDDADFDDWGSSDDSEELESEFEDDADFDDWGSDEEDEPEEELEDDADFDDWGSSDEVEEEDFDDWGSGEEVEPKVTKGTPSKQVKRSPASELKSETEMMDFFERCVNSLFRSTISNGKKFGRRFASLPENEEK